MREVNRRQLKAFQLDVAPDVQLGPVRQREHPHLLAAAQASVVQRPWFGPLSTRVPLPELVTKTQDALLSARTFLVAAGATERRVESAGFQRVEQRPGLLAVA